MRNRTKKLVALLMILSLGLSIFGNSFDNTAKAATKKVVLNKKKITVNVKKKVTVKVKNSGKKKVKAKVANKKIATVKVSKKKLTITGKKAGKTKLTVTVKGMKKCVVSVTVKKDKKVVATQQPQKTAEPAKTAEATSTAEATATVKPTATATTKVTATPTAEPTVKPTATPTNEKVTRLQWLTELFDCVATPILTSEEVTDFSFTDISEEKDNLIVETAVQNALITNDEVAQSKGKFCPNEIATKEFAYTTALRLLGYYVDTIDITTDELDKTCVYARYSQTAINVKMAKSNSKGKYNVHGDLDNTVKKDVLDFVEKKNDELNTTPEEEDNSVFAKQFNEDAVDEEAEYQIAKQDDDFIVTILKSKVSDLKENDSFYLPPSETCPDGVSLVAKKIEDAGVNYIITASQVASIEQIYDEVDKQGTFDISVEDFTPAEGVEIEEPQKNKSRKRASNSDSGNGSGHIDLKADGDIHVNISQPQFGASIKMDGADLQAVTVQVTQNTTVSANLSGEYNKDVTLGDCSVGILDVAGVRLHFILSLHINAKGEAELKASVDTMAGIKFDAGTKEILPIKECKISSDIKVNISAKALLNFDIKLTALEYKIFGIQITEGYIVIDVGAEGGIGLYGEFQMHNSADFEGKKLTCSALKCATLKAYPILTIYVGREEDSLFRKVYDYITGNDSPYEMAILDENNGYFINRHWELKDDEADWTRVYVCSFDDEEFPKDKKDKDEEEEDYSLLENMYDSLYESIENQGLTLGNGHCFGIGIGLNGHLGAPNVLYTNEDQGDSTYIKLDTVVNGHIKTVFEDNIQGLIGLVERGVTSDGAVGKSIELKNYYIGWACSKSVDSEPDLVTYYRKINSTNEATIKLYRNINNKYRKVEEKNIHVDSSAEDNYSNMKKIINSSLGIDREYNDLIWSGHSYQVHHSGFAEKTGGKCEMCEELEQKNN